MSNGKQIIERLIAEAVAAHTTCTNADDAWLNQLQAMRTETLRIVDDFNAAERAAADTLARLKAQIELSRAELDQLGIQVRAARELLQETRRENEVSKSEVARILDGILAKTKVA